MSPPTPTSNTERHIAEAVQMAADATRISAELGQLAQAAVGLRAQVIARLVTLTGSQSEAARRLDTAPSTINKLIQRRPAESVADLAQSIARLAEQAAAMAAAMAGLEKRLTEGGGDPQFAEPPVLTGQTPEPEPVPR